MAGARSGSTRDFVVEDDVLHNWRLLLLVQDKTMNQAADLDELSLFRDMARRAFEQEITPHYEQWEADKMVPRTLWHRLGEAGLL